MGSDFTNAACAARRFALDFRLVAAALAGLVLVAGTSACVAADDEPAADAAAAPAAPPTAKSTSKTKTDHRVSLNFKAASWSKVLKRVARHAGLTLVMKTAPTGTFTRHDLNQYSVAEVLWILNRELEPSGFRVVEQGGFLMLLDLDGLRSGYSPAVARRPVPDQTPQSGSGVQQVAGNQTGGEPGLLESVAPETARESAAAGHDDDSNDEIANRGFSLFFVSTPWTTVLPYLAKQAGLVLVMRRCPSGNFQHPEFKKINLAEALELVNKALDDSPFRVVRQGQFLVVLYKPDLRTEYERPVMRARRNHELRDDDASDERPARSRTSSDVRQVSHESEVWRDTGNVNIPTTTDLPVTLMNGRELTGPMPLTSREPAAPAPALAPVENPKPEEFEEAPGATAQTSNFVPKHDTATAVAQRLYASLKGRTELLQAGPKGLPSFRVFDAPSEHQRALKSAGRDKRADFPTTFTVALDAQHNNVVIEATPRRLSAALRLCERLDRQSASSALPLQLVSADAETLAIAKNLAPQLDRLVAQRGPEETVAQAVPAPPSANEPANPQQGTTPLSPTGQQGISEIIKGLKGDVTVESVPELGILILRGGQSDVAAVMKVIREIERLSAVAVPQIELFPLKYVDSESLATLLNSVYKALATARVEGAGAGRTVIQFFPIVKPNSLLILAPPADIPGVKKLASQLDQPVNKEVEFQVFHLQHGYAAQVANSITRFYATPRSLGTTVNVFADPRTNSIIVQARARDLAEVGRLVVQLDSPTASQATIKIFPLQNSDATSIQRLLETLFGTAQQPGQAGQQQQQQGQGPGGFGGGFAGGGGTAGGSQQQAPTQLRLSSDVRTNSIIALGPSDTLQAVEAIILKLDNSTVHQRKTTVIRLKNNAADNVARALTDFVQSQRQLQQIDPEAMSSIELLEREVFAVAEPVSNTLLLSATPRYYDQLTQMISKLDAPPAQVIIQALIVQVQLTNDDEFGIELGFQSPVLFNRSNISNLTTLQTTTTLNTNTSIANNQLLSSTATPGFQFGDPTYFNQMTNPINPSQVGSQELTSLGVGRTSPNIPGVSGLVLSANSESVSFLLRALSYKQTIHVLSRPQIRTLDNRMASIQVGQRVPVIFGATINATTGTPQPIIQYDNAGIILTVQPRITPEGMIALEAYAEKSEYETSGGVTILSVPGGASVTSPIKDITRCEASVNVASGNTVVMGGMITSSDTVTTSKVPWAGDIPVIGQFFRSDTKYQVRTELLIFLTPRVIRDDADEEMIKQVETERIHFLVDEAEQMHGPILGTKPPALQECPQEGPPVAPVMQGPESPLSGPVPPMPSVPAQQMIPLTPETVPGGPTSLPFLPAQPTPGAGVPGPAMPGAPPVPVPPAVGPRPPQSGLTPPPAAMPPAAMRTNLTPGFPEDSGSVRAASN